MNEDLRSAEEVWRSSAEKWEAECIKQDAEIEALRLASSRLRAERENVEKWQQGRAQELRRRQFMIDDLRAEIAQLRAEVVQLQADIRALVEATEEAIRYLERLPPDHPDMPASQCRADLLRAAIRKWEQGDGE